ncbi:MAG: ATP-binding protein [Bacteroidaceae bacterium]
MEKPFVYGMSVEGNNFTDREKETERLKKDFENGVNVILISPRRMGKTSLVKKVCSEIADPGIKTVMMDIYDCRSEYDFYNRFASVLIKETAGRMELVMDNVRRFLSRVSPRISFSPEPMTEYSVSLGITPENYSPEEILDLPETIAREKGIHIVVCIDEFQQIGEMPDTLLLQKRMRGVWQHHTHVSYCLYGSKKHLMTNLFHNKRMPFYRFGETNELSFIPTDAWVPFIRQRFACGRLAISDAYAARICDYVGNHSSYVQQLSWNVMAETRREVDEDSFVAGCEALLAQCNSYFLEQIRGMSSYQMNFIRLLCSGVEREVGSRSAQALYPLGSKSNVSRIKSSLAEREIIELMPDGRIRLADCVFQRWFAREWM